MPIDTLPMHFTSNLRAAVRCAGVASAALVSFGGGEHLTLLSASHADVVVAECATDGSSFRYRVNRMPDFTQRRQAFADTGAMYCIPTSSMDLFAYAAKHGFPWTSPGVAHWQSQANYDEATYAIAQMAELMGTTGTGGTTSAGTIAGFSALAVDSESLEWQVRLRTRAFPIQLADLVQAACSGWIVAPVRGAYEVTGTYEGHPLVKRKSGHGIVMTVARLTREDQTFAYRNPDSDTTDFMSQPPFANTVVDFETVVVALGESADEIYAATALAYTPGDATILIIDGMRLLRPTYGVTFLPSSSGIIGGTIAILDPTPFDGSPSTFGGPFPIDAGETVLEVALHPDLRHAFVLVQPAIGPSELRTLDLFEGTWASTSAPTGLERFCVSPNDQLYASAGTTVQQLALDGTPLAMISGLDPVSAIAYDNASERVVVFSTSARSIKRLPPDLSRVDQHITFPDSATISGDGDLVVDQQDGSVWVCSQGSDDIYSVTAAPPFALVTVSSGAITSPIALGTDASGRIYVSCDDGMRALYYSGAAQEWLVDFASPFDRLASGTRLRLVSSNTNYDPAVHSTELGWVDTPADELPRVGVIVPDCTADLDGNDVVDGADLGALLGDWGVTGLGADYSDADLNADGMVDGADLGLMLGQWGMCMSDLRALRGEDPSSSFPTGQEAHLDLFQSQNLLNLDLTEVQMSNPCHSSGSIGSSERVIRA